MEASINGIQRLQNESYHLTNASVVLAANQPGVGQGAPDCGHAPVAGMHRPATAGGFCRHAGWIPASPPAECSATGTAGEAHTCWRLRSSQLRVACTPLYCLCTAPGVCCALSAVVFKALEAVNISSGAAAQVAGVLSAVPATLSKAPEGLQVAIEFLQDNVNDVSEACQWRERGCITRHRHE